jgi:hypothetical protein
LPTRRILLSGHPRKRLPRDLSVNSAYGKPLHVPAYLGVDGAPVATERLAEKREWALSQRPRPHRRGQSSAEAARLCAEGMEAFMDLRRFQAHSLRGPSGVGVSGEAGSSWRALACPSVRALGFPKHPTEGIHGLTRAPHHRFARSQHRGRGLHQPARFPASACGSAAVPGAISRSQRTALGRSAISGRNWRSPVLTLPGLQNPQNVGATIDPLTTRGATGRLMDHRKLNTKSTPNTDGRADGV